MKKLICCFSFVCMGMLSSCVDKNELVDEESMPEWLGSSIYEELKNPNAERGLQGTFNTYLRLVDDLGYAETLNRTGSNTVFPANDEAFARFFASGTWEGVTSYESLSTGQKRLLLFSSMLKNAMLVSMLSNTSSSDGVQYGRALKHETAVSAIDSVTYYPGRTALDAYGERNPYWTDFTGGISVVSDATTPMLVHFTREYMLNNSITTSGEGNDFSILTGGEYEPGSSYVFDNKIITPDVTCQNGYIHQVQDVVVPPGNMAAVIKKDASLSLFNHLLDRFAVPVANSDVTADYKDWYKGMQDAGNNMAGVNNPDMIYEVRYLSQKSQGSTTFDNSNSSNTSLLAMDPGWNSYYVPSIGTSTGDPYLVDLMAMFVPDDEALTDYFVTGEGKTILDTYGQLPNTKENVMRNIEDIPMNIAAKFISNMQKSSFAASVPSKFSSIVDDAKDVMGVTLESLKKNGSSYDIKVANNGVIYVTNTVFGPKEFVAVSAPALFSTNMNIANWIIQNKSISNTYSLGLDYYAYLLAMASNYALFLPTDEAFDFYYIDPATAYETTDNVKRTPLAYHYTFVPNPKVGDPQIKVERYNYDMKTHTVGTKLAGDPEDGISLQDKTNMAIVKSQLSDLIQLCTVPLAEGEKLGSNTYYKAKSGAAIKITGFTDGNVSGTATVAGGGQISSGLPVSRIVQPYSQANGMSYSVDHVLQAPMQSVYKVLKDNEQFSEFFNLCSMVSDDDVLKAAGYSATANATGIYEVDKYKVFYYPGDHVADPDQSRRCPDMNIKYFSNYNYTVFAPNNAAMQKAYAKQLPTPDMIDNLADRCDRADGDELETLQAQLKKMIDVACSFIRYHFQNTSIYADNIVASGNYVTLLVDGNNISRELAVSGGGGTIQITDATGTPKYVKVSDGGLVNEMARDVEFDMTRTKANYVKNSSYAVVHELSEPLSYNKSGDYSQAVTSSAKGHKSLRK